MKKRIFALALALCMMLSVMPTSFAGNGFLTLDNGEQAPSAPSGILTDDSKAAPQSGVLTVDGAQPSVEEVPEQPAEETPVYGVLTPDQPEEKAPVVQQPVQPAPGVLSMVCDVCGYYDGYHAADCATQQPEDESPEVEETPAQEQTEPVVTIPQEPVVTNYTVETVSTTRTARTLNVARNAAAYAALSASLMTLSDEDSGVEAYSDELVTLPNNSLEMSKDVKQDGDSYIITLEAYATGSSVTTSTTTKVPTDIVLVLDVSGSMAPGLFISDPYINVGSKNDVVGLDTVYGASEGIYEYKWGYTDITWASMRYNSETATWQYNGAGGWKNLSDSIWSEIVGGGQNIRISKLNAMKIACKKFIDLTAAESIDEDGNVVADHKISIVSYATDATTVKGLTPAVAGATELKTAIDGLSAGGGTMINEGLENANSVLNDSAAGRNRVVIALTDGDPGQSGFDTNTANAAIKQAYALKAAKDDDVSAVLTGATGKGATVYSIGIFENTNTGEVTDSTANRDRFMHYISSNFKTATSMDNGGTATYGDYYHGVSTSAGLTGIFETINSSITSGGAGDKTLGTNTVLKDVISPYFEIPEGSSVVYHTESYNYDTEKNVDVWISDNNDQTVIPSADGTVEVSGFNYTENWVGPRTDAAGKTTYSGKKLVVEISVVPKTGFLGGNDVPTNVHSNAGIYKEDGALVENFPATDAKANVDIPAVSVTVPEQNIYLTNTVDLEGLKADATVKIGDVELDASSATFGLQAWQYAYVDISVLASSNLTVKEAYVDCIVKAKTDPDTNKEENSGTADVNIFLPHVTHSDYTVYLGGEVPAFEKSGVTWVHESVAYDADKMNGEEPAVVATDYEVPDTFDTCTDVSVTEITVAGETFTDSFTADTFMVHVLKPQLTLSTENLWADYGETVDLTSDVLADGTTKYIDTALSAEWIDVNSKSDSEHVAPEVYGARPVEINVSYEVYKDSDKVTKHKVKTTDTDFTAKIVGFQVGYHTIVEEIVGDGVEYKDVIVWSKWFKPENAAMVNEEDNALTIYVNKFDLTINKTWDAVEDCYKQDVIFTVTGDYGTGENQSIQVVIPVGKTSVKVVGLLCGQSYSVAEANPEGINWAWRFTNTQKPNVTCNVRHDVISTTAHPRHTVTADFTNSNPATKWFDAIASKFNIFGKGDN